ncbi:MAG TPA: hypothetical protein VEA59_01950 [Patescibacteria group bacterium]|nr:hypothetical protein [Patescibacteria group bacterium]
MQPEISKKQLLIACGAFAFAAIITAFILNIRKTAVETNVIEDAGYILPPPTTK